MSVAFSDTAPGPVAASDARRWEDEIVYVVIIEKFFNGDPANDIMRERFLEEREHYQGGYWGGDLSGVIAKLDDLTDLGITTFLLYPVIERRGSGRQVPADRLPPERLRTRRQEFRRQCNPARARRRRPRPQDASHPRNAPGDARV
jgi:hypothetical protein